MAKQPIVNNQYKSDNSGCILINGYIDMYDVSSKDFIEELRELEEQYSTIDVRINSFGGSVAEGITILNALKGSKANINIYIDGVAASMASAIAFAGFKTTAARCSLMMIHSPSSYCHGSKKDMDTARDMLEKWEDILSQAYASKVDMTPEQIREKYFDGTDHWMTADEAKALGFVDELYGDEDEMPTNSSAYQVYAQCRATYDKPPVAQSQNQNDMKLEQFTAMEAFASCKDEGEVLNRISTLVTAAARADQLDKENKSLKGSLQEYKDKEVKAQKDAANAAIKAAIDNGRITEEQRASFEALFAADPVNAQAALDAIPQPKSAADYLGGNGGGVSASGGAWDQRQQELKDQLNQ